MEGNEIKCLGFCQRLFECISKILAKQAVKKTVLGYPNPTTDAKADTKIIWSEKVDSKKRSDPSSSFSSSSLRSLLEKEKELRAEEESKAPKKMVSINDRVEDLYEAAKRRRKSKSFDKSSSFPKNEEDEAKPLRPILKAPSNLEVRTDELVNSKGS